MPGSHPCPPHIGHPANITAGEGGTAAWAPALREALSLSMHRYTRCKHTQAASNVALHCKNLRY